MASELLVNLKEEVTCPICLDLLIEPLSLDCGHSFCQACITGNHKKSIIDQEVESSCPVCRITYQPGNLRPNRHVSNIVERLREVRSNPEERQKIDHCAHHGEKLLLFCEEDGKVICWLCERSQEHRGHHTLLMEEVAQKYQEMLQAVLEKHMKEQQEAEKLKANIREERTSWKNQIQCDRENIQAQFDKLRDILHSEENEELQKLEKEKEDILDSLAESENELVQHSLSVGELVSDLEDRLQGPAIRMLQDVNDVIKRSETLTLKTPKTFPKEQRRVFQAPDLRGMLQVFKELKDVQRYWVYVTLAPSNNPNVAISSDNRQVVSKRISRAFDSFMIDNPYYDIMGSPVITSGKHYWEVDVTQKRAWIMGVCVEQALPQNTVYDQGIYVEQDHPQNILFGQGKRVGRARPQNIVYGHNLRGNYQPQNGYWVIGLKNTFEYNAFQDSVPSGSVQSSQPLIVTLSLTVPPKRVGIFVDYEAGTVSFFNVTNHGFLIYKFSTGFSRPVRPYLNSMECQFPVTLC
ncbi:tripartite motif-containing protein 5 [Lemur catta]|uniref:RING-type E3 ubiquitin transferase n=1 Tax=Lemur catta TaxID=9447 RepID=F5A681_LEMCA|nr:tripartite motif-containing protein 5 [Lemur catta]AEB96597.1 tripartite motif-containing 5 [Lemur catta]